MSDHSRHSGDDRKRLVADIEEVRALPTPADLPGRVALLERKMALIVRYFELGG